MINFDLSTGIGIARNAISIEPHNDSIQNHNENANATGNWDGGIEYLQKLHTESLKN